MNSQNKRIALPSILNTIADVAGLNAALALAKARGGSTVSLPSKLKKDHWLIKTVGKAAAEKICKHYRTGYGGTSGAVLSIPLGPTSEFNRTIAQNREKIDRMILQGASADKIAVEVGVSRSTVFRRRAKLFPKKPKSKN